MTKRDLTLRLLTDAGGGWVTTAEFVNAGCGTRFGARIQELRDQGRAITSEYLRPGSYRYRLADVGVGISGGEGSGCSSSGHPAADASPTPELGGADDGIPPSHTSVAAELSWIRDYTDPEGEWMMMPTSEWFDGEQLRLAA